MTLPHLGPLAVGLGIITVGIMIAMAALRWAGVVVE
jgi:hypothetical protein